MIKNLISILMFGFALLAAYACTPQKFLPPTATVTNIPASPPPGQSTTITNTPSIAELWTPVPWFEHGFEGLDDQQFGPDFQPTGLAVAKDGTLFLATRAEGFIFHTDPYGKVLAHWGGFLKPAEGEKAPPGVFNEPWGMAISPDGSLYIVDTWNHRIQKFTQDGTFLVEWGEGGIGNDPDKFFGPRGVALDSYGHVLVTDTGNKRVVVYDGDGSFISQIGSEGSGPGQFNEPVGIAVDADNHVYVADSWNRRVQVLQIDAAGNLTPANSWQVDGWGSQSIDHKPFLCVCQNNLFATDPEHNQVIWFSLQGALIETLDLKSKGILIDGIPNGIACDPTGGIWISDLKYNMWSHLTP
jgi:DNA-binding beta-propeller fold protein YncE